MYFVLFCLIFKLIHNVLLVTNKQHGTECQKTGQQKGIRESTGRIAPIMVAILAEHATRTARHGILGTGTRLLLYGHRCAFTCNQLTAGGHCFKQTIFVI